MNQDLLNELLKIGKDERIVLSTVLNGLIVQRRKGRLRDECMVETVIDHECLSSAKFDMLTHALREQRERMEMATKCKK